MLLAAELLHHLFGAFIGEVGTAHHQDEDDRLRQEPAQQKGAGQQDKELVLQAADGDLADDRQFATWIEPSDIARRHGRIVNDNAGRLASGPAGSNGDVIDRCSSGPRNHRNVVEKGYKSAGHSLLPK